MRTYHSILQLQAPIHTSLQCRHVLRPGWLHRPRYSANSVTEKNKNRIWMKCVTKQLYFPTGCKFPCINSLSFLVVLLVYKLFFLLFSSDKDIHTLCGLIIPSDQRGSPTLIISMHLVMEVAWTQTNGSDLMLSAHSSHLRSSASLMQHQRTMLLSKELPASEGRSTVRSCHLCTNLFFAKGMFRSMQMCLIGSNNTEREKFLPFP